MSASKVLKVTVKYGKTKHKGIELDMDTMSFEGLQAIIFSLTQVSPERQKIIIKGKQVESDGDLKIIKNKAVLVIMGSVETLQKAADKSISNVQFMEDMTDKEKQQVNAALPPGLYNLGNTCYLNSTLQCMKGIDELRDGLIHFGIDEVNNTDNNNNNNNNNRYMNNNNNNNNNNRGFTRELGNLFGEMSTTSDSVNPVSFVQNFRGRFPEFATRNEQGAWEQQDAEECLTKLLSTMKTEGLNQVDDLFEGEFQSEMKCIESEDEAVVSMQEKFFKLRCFIDSDTRHIAFGIEKSMKEELTKHSSILNRNAQWIKTQKISKLPKYLTVSMVRFFWKQSKQKNAKILRSVQFDMKLDVTNFCNDKVRQRISKFRKLKMEAEDEIREKNQKKGIKLEEEKKQNNNNNNNNDKNKNKNNDKTTSDKNNNDNKNNDNTNNDKDDKNDKNGPKGKGEETDEKKLDSMEVDDASELHESGFYELIGLITHKGLSANSGHYIGYSKDAKRGWLKFDDDIVTEVKEDDIKKLYGGGQWQMGYVCFYKKMDAVIPKE